MGCDPSAMYAPRDQFHHQEDIIRYEPVPRSDLHREEVCRLQDLPVQRQELPPAHPDQINFSLLAEY